MTSVLASNSQNLNKETFENIVDHLKDDNSWDFFKKFYFFVHIIFSQLFFSNFLSLMYKNRESANWQQKVYENSDNYFYKILPKMPNYLLLGTLDFGHCTARNKAKSSYQNSFRTVCRSRQNFRNIIIMSYEYFHFKLRYF